jgi:ribosomal protein S18 acetylase RimI-like enzyme
MLTTRAATADDAVLIAAHRKAMFAAMGGSQETALETMRQNAEPWTKNMILAGKYAGWISSDGDRPVASAGLMVLDWPPHPLDPGGERRGYMLNVYTEPEYRGRGLAGALVELCLAEANRRGIRIVALHSSDAGRRIYERFGFKASNEMLLVTPAG